LINGKTKLDVHCSSKLHYPSGLFWLCKTIISFALHKSFCVKYILRLWLKTRQSRFFIYISFTPQPALFALSEQFHFLTSARAANPALVFLFPTCTFCIHWELFFWR
jgi:hypothetical protein